MSEVSLARDRKRNYGNSMVPRRLKIAQIGNSRGVRLPAASLRRYRIGDSVLMEERSEGILLRPLGPTVEKLSWEDTAREMAISEDEDWTAWDATDGDGLDTVPWQAERVAEPRAAYRRAPRRRTRR